MEFKFFHKNDVPSSNRSLLPHEQVIPYQNEGGAHTNRVIAWKSDLPGDDWIGVKYTGTISGFFSYRPEIPQIKRIQIEDYRIDSPQTCLEYFEWLGIYYISNVRVIIWYFEPQVN